MVYDVTDPASASFVTYFTGRDFRGAPRTHTAGDLSPEGLKFIPADKNPTGQPLLAVANEVSGTTTILRVDAPQADLANADLTAPPNVEHETASRLSSLTTTDDGAARPGDVNHDGYFNQLDVVTMLQAGNYQTGRSASLEEGDFNGDGKFDELDVVAALTEGNYLAANNQVAAIDAVLAEYSDLR